MNRKLQKAIEIQRLIDTRLGIDITAYQRSDLRYLSDNLQTFLNTGVETEDLSPVDELHSAEDEMDTGEYYEFDEDLPDEDDNS